MQAVGALLEARAVHTSRSAYNHLRALAATHGISRSRVDEVIDMVGLQEVARKRAGGFSLGMGQRLGIATALLGDPPTVVLDEPVNGLDPEGIVWIRNLMKRLAAQGRTIFVSSHLMGEISITADHLVVIGRGQLIADCATDEFIERYTEQSVLVRSPDGARLRDAVAGEGGRVVESADGVFSVFDLPAARIGELAAASGLVLHELSPQRASLEEAFMELTRDSLEYAAPPAAEAPAAAPIDPSEAVNR
jgi:ABC-2 type transport system ATP-binding protein